MSAHPRSPLVVAMTAILVMAVGMAWHSAAAQGTSATPAPLVKIKLGWQKLPTLAANYLMAQDAKKYGLDIELVEFNRYTDMRVALENGLIDFGSFGPGDMALSADTGRSNVVALAGEATGADLLAKRAGLGKVTWKDLASGQIPFGSFGAGIAWVKTVATMDEHGYDFGKVNEIKIAGTIYDVMQTLKAGSTKVVMDVEPAIAQGVKEGYAEYADELDINSSSLGGQNALFVANRKMLDRPEVMRQVLRDYVDQITKLQRDPGLWVQTYQSYTGLDKMVAEPSLRRIHLDLRFSQDELSSFAKFLVKKGLAKTENLPETVKARYVYEPLAEVTGKSAQELGKSTRQAAAKN
jgi:sulfonate transport system substrate-binding protein